MNQDNFGDKGNNFGTGFILGAIFGALAVFFLATKTGREFIKKINFANFDLEKFSQILEKENFDESDLEPEDYGGQRLTDQPPILGRRFFRRHHQNSV